MNPEVMVSVLSAAIAGLFGALMLSMRQQREDWKALYEAERTDHKETRKAAAEEGRNNAASIQNIAKFLDDLPKRRDDWDPTGQEGRMPGTSQRDRRRE